MKTGFGQCIIHDNVSKEKFLIFRRVVNVSSRAGDVEKITNSSLKTRLISEDLTMDELKKIMDDFVS